MKAGGRDEGNRRQGTKWICQSQVWKLRYVLYKREGNTGIAYLPEALYVNSLLARGACF